MEKVLLTLEQSEAVEMAKVRKEIEWLLEDCKSEWFFEYKSLNGLTVAQLARAFYVGYEVEEIFKPGDRVMYKNAEGFEKLKGVFVLSEKHQIPLEHFKDQNAWRIEGSNDFELEKEFRHATPEEIYWLETLGREKVGDFKIGDTVLADDGTTVRITTPYILAQTDRTFNEHPEEIVGIYPEESFKPFPGSESE